MAHELVSKIAITSTRDNPTNPFFAAEIYLINPDGTDPQRLTDNDLWRRIRRCHRMGRRSCSTATGSLRTLRTATH